MGRAVKSLTTKVKTTDGKISRARPRATARRRLGESYRRSAFYGRRHSPRHALGQRFCVAPWRTPELSRSTRAARAVSQASRPSLLHKTLVRSLPAGPSPICRYWRATVCASSATRWRRWRQSTRTQPKKRSASSTLCMKSCRRSSIPWRR